MIHDVDITYYLCGDGDCEFRAKVAHSVSAYKTITRDIDVNYYLLIFRLR